MTIAQELAALEVWFCTFCQAPDPQHCDPEHGPVCDGCMDRLEDGTAERDHATRAAEALFGDADF